MRIETLQTFDQSDVWTKRQKRLKGKKAKQTKRQKDKKDKRDKEDKKDKRDKEVKKYRKYKKNLRQKDVMSGQFCTLALFFLSTFRQNLILKGRRQRLLGQQPFSPPIYQGRIFFYQSILLTLVVFINLFIKIRMIRI